MVVHIVRYACEECGREHKDPDLAKLCEDSCRRIKLSQAKFMGDEKAWRKMGHATWVENGEHKHAPKVKPARFGPHDYPNEDGTSDCKFGCGCWMGPARSGGPTDPFGACPKNPKRKPLGGRGG